MVLSQPAQLGFSITAPFRKVGNVLIRVVEDPRAQRVASVSAQAYAPDQYAQAQGYANEADQILHPHQVVALLPKHGPPMPYAVDAGGGGGNLPVQKSHMLGIAAVAGAGLLLLLILRK